jgi:hypothetical protein
LTATGAVAAPLTLTLSDSATNSASTVLTVGHNSTGSALTGFGTEILFKGEGSADDQNMGHIQAVWATPATPTSYLAFRARNAGDSATAARLYFNGGITLGGTSDPGVQIMNAPGGYTISGAPTTGKMMQSNGTVYTDSTPTWPTAAGAVGYTLRSDATNFASYPAQLVNSSVTSQSPTTSDVYLTGSNIVLSANGFQAKGQYKCVFDMTKSTGTGAIVITLRVGTAGTTADAAIQTYTFGAGTSVADTGIFEVIATWRTVGSGTSAVIQSICRGTHQLSTTGLFNNAAGWVLIGSPSPSSGFASNTATNIGISFNGSTAFAGTTQVVQAQLQQ